MNSIPLHSAVQLQTILLYAQIEWFLLKLHMGERRNVYNILVGKHDGKRTLDRPSNRYEVNIRMDLREIGWEGVDWMHLAQDRDK
jgi:hypothetical protein